MTLERYITLTDGEYLSDVEAQLPNTNGIHVIDAKTGVGKTRRMTLHAHANYGALIYPIKAIAAQQWIELADLIKEHGSTLARIDQIEHIERNRYDDRLCLHIDEGQILYTGGFRLPVEVLIDLIVWCSQRMPVYIYSATLRPEFLPQRIVDNIKSWTTVSKGWRRSINRITIQTSGYVIGNTIEIAGAISHIWDRAPGDPDRRLPTLAFVNSEKRAASVVNQLNEWAKTLPEDERPRVLYTDATRISARSADTEARDAYQRIIETATLSASGYDIVISTNTLAEGINLNDRINVVSVQASADVVFQQQGRARKDAVHWLITGRGYSEAVMGSTSPIARIRDLNGGDLYWKSIGDDPNDLTTDEPCGWSDLDAAQRADAYQTITHEQWRGDYAEQVVRELAEYGYTPQSYTVPNQTHQHKGSRVEVPKRQVMAAIAEHRQRLYEQDELMRGIPVSRLAQATPRGLSEGKKTGSKAPYQDGECPSGPTDQNHRVFKDLLETHPINHVIIGVASASTWWNACAALRDPDRAHVRLNIDPLTTYAGVNVAGRNWLSRVVKDKERCAAISATLDGLHTAISQRIPARATRCELPGDLLDDITDTFWIAVEGDPVIRGPDGLPIIDPLTDDNGDPITGADGQPLVIERRKQSGIWSDSNADTRETLVKLLLGMEQQENRHWIYFADSERLPFWDVPLDNAQGNRYRARVKHITAAGATVPDFCKTTKHTKATIADTKPGIIKKQAAAVVSGAEIIW
ncbi:hypothetical protein ACEUCD_17150 [Aeromonas veronii]